MLLSRVRKRFTKTKENVCEDDKARRGKGTSSKTTLTSSSSSKTIPLLLCFSSFLPSSSSRVFFRVRRKEEDEVRESHICNVCWSSSPRKNNTLCYILSLSLSCARRTNDAHTFTNTFYYHETTTLVKIQRKSKRKKLGNARKPRKRPRNARTTREPPRKAQGRFGWRKVYNYYSSSFSEDFLTTIFLLLPDLAELKLEKGMAIKFPNGKSDLMNFRIEIKPSENYWRGGTFTFTFKVPDSYPHEPPKVLCDQKVYHPNLDTQGNICLNVLREDWSPVQTVTSVIFGLLFLFIDPNASDPLNSEAAKDLMQSTANFKANVRKAMMGGSINGVRFTKVM